MNLKTDTPNENLDMMLNTSNIKIALDQAIANDGGTGHFVLPGTPVDNIRQATDH